MRDFATAQAKCSAIAQGVNTAKPTGMLVGLTAILEAHAQHLENVAGRLHRMADHIFGSSPDAAGEAGSDKETPPSSHTDTIGRLNKRISLARNSLDNALARLEQLV